MPDLALAGAIVGQERDEHMAKFHPPYLPIVVPSARHTAMSPPTAPAPVPGADDGTLGQSGLLGQAQSGATTPPTKGNDGRSSISPLNHPQPSGVAVASLNAAAFAAGLTLEQLAVALSHTTSLQKALESVPDTKQQLAMNLFREECGTLYKRSMLLAGYSLEECEEASEAYKQFAVKAMTREEKRLERYLAGVTEPPSPPNGFDLQATPAPQYHATENDKMDAHSHAHGHGAEQGEKGCFDGRHAHRLEGKCGHQAVLHKPEGAPWHVDFVLNGMLECYAGIKPVGTNAALWLSRYSCSELSCQSESDEHKVRARL